MGFKVWADLGSGWSKDSHATWHLLLKSLGVWRRLLRGYAACSRTAALGEGIACRVVFQVVSFAESNAELTALRVLKYGPFGFTGYPEVYMGSPTQGPYGRTTRTTLRNSESPSS